MQVFPVDLQGKPYYAQAYNQSHHGTDIFAPRGTQVFAVEPGQVRKDDDPKGGTVVYLTTAAGDKYYYAHLDEVIGTMPRSVRAGDIIGLVGNSGNARGKATHLHFQVSDPVLGTVDPYPLLRDVDVQSPGVKPSTTPRSSADKPQQRIASNWNGLVLLGLLWFATRRARS